MEKLHRSSSCSSGYQTGTDSNGRKQQQQADHAATRCSSNAKALFRVASSSDDDAKSSDSGGGGSVVTSRSRSGNGVAAADKAKVKQELQKLRRLSDAAAAAADIAKVSAAAKGDHLVPLEDGSGNSLPLEQDLVDVLKFAYILQVGMHNSLVEIILLPLSITEYVSAVHTQM